ncbi:MAG: hypothetical protein RR272_01095 [Synergistaceae bacterium]
MKKILLILFMAMLFATPSYAAFSSKGQIPRGEPVEYRGLKITQDGVNMIIINRGDKTVTFSASCVFGTERGKTFGDFFIPKTELAPLEQKQMRGLFLKGDPKQCKAAEKLFWTVYELEEK